MHCPSRLRFQESSLALRGDSVQQDLPWGAPPAGSSCPFAARSLPSTALPGSMGDRKAERGSSSDVPEKREDSLPRDRRPLTPTATQWPIYAHLDGSPTQRPPYRILLRPQKQHHHGRHSKTPHPALSSPTGSGTAHLTDDKTKTQHILAL